MARNLAARGDHRALVSLVEKWWTVGEPPVSVRLAASRSLLELRALDRAYGRLKELVEAERPHQEALALAVEIQLHRAWLGPARKLAQRGLELEPSSPVFRALLARASEAPTDPDEGAVDPETTSVAELLRVAEQHLAAGQQVKARGLLERVRRRAPENRRAVDLLWAMDGDFDASDPLTLAELCDRLGAGLSDRPEPQEEPERTESLRSSGLAVPAEPDRSFPALFRGQGGTPETTGSGQSEREVTAVSSMADIQRLLDGPAESELTDPLVEDTQIVRIQPKSPQRAAPSAPPRSRGGSTNLADLARPAPAAKLDVQRDVPTSGEDEDESVIVHLRREEDPADAETPTGAVRGMDEELRLEKATASKRGAAEDDRWASAKAPESRAERAERRRSKAEPQAAPAPAAPVSARPARAQDLISRSWPWWLAVLAGLLALAAIFVVSALLAFALGS